MRATTFRSTRAGLLLLPIVLFLSRSAHAQVEATFDADLEGWTVEGDNDYFWNPTEGDPGGCIEIQDAVSGPWNVAVAPAAFLGDWSVLSPADSLSYDAIHMPLNGQSGAPPYIFRIEGPGGAAQYHRSLFPADVWNHFAAPLDSTAWTVTAGTWSGTLANVARLTVAAEMVSGSEVDRVDNVRLGGSPGPAFHACEVEHYEVGLTGWTPASVSLTRVTTGGDIGAYLQVTESGAGARVLAPAWYSGDWSAMDGAGAVSFSLTILSHTVEHGRDIRVELDGPGGSAFASEPSDAFVPPPHVWHVFSWPLDESAWTVTSGTWSGLLADVEQMAISADVSSGNDQYGLDNVARGLSCNPDPVSPLVFHEPDYSQCDALRFRDASALAINPADGELYTLVHATPSGGGGVYAATGSSAGTQLQPFSSPIGLVFTADGDGFVTENNAGVLYRFVGADSLMTWASTFHDGDDDVAGMILAPPGFEGPNVTAGDILVTDHGNSGPDEIWAVSPDSANGEHLLVPDPGNVDWYDLATDGTTVWVCDALDPNALWIIQPDGSTSFLALSENVAGKRALAYDSGQHCLYTMKTTNPIGLYRIDPANGQVTLIADGFTGVGYGNLEIDPVARKLWVADEAQSRIWVICLPPADAVDAREPAPRSAGFTISLHPQPVVRGTRISLRLPQAALVHVDIVDAAGRRVRRLDGGMMPAGLTALEWDARDGRGRRVPAGVYFLRVEAGGLLRTGKAVVLR